MRVWKPTRIKCQCGGRVEIRDHGLPEELPDEDGGYDPEFRFEACCDKCRECDPNGYATKGEALAGAREYFMGKNADD